MKDSIELSEKLVEEFKDTGRFFTNGPGPSALMWDSQDIRFDELEEKIAQAIHSTNTSLLEENKRLREAIEKAPHEEYCRMPYCRDAASNYTCCPCTCWKSQVHSQQEVDPSADGVPNLVRTQKGKLPMTNESKPLPSKSEALPPVKGGG